MLVTLPATEVSLGADPCADARQTVLDRAPQPMLNIHEHGILPILRPGSGGSAQGLTGIARCYLKSQDAVTPLSVKRRSLLLVPCYRRIVTRSARKGALWQPRTYRAPA